MRPFSLLIKPASADCNLRCRYCFYLGACALYPESPRHRMDDATLERTIRSYLATEQSVHTFGWQGGEPTLLGAGFFRRVVNLQTACGGPGTRVANGLQTNGTLVDDELAGLLGEYRFLVGVSLDGPAALHDAERRNAAGQGSHAAVLAGIERLRRHKVEFNILTLVNRANAGRPAEVYDYLVDAGFLYHQYVECVEFDAAGALQPFAITGPEWGAFLCAVFDRWYAKDTRRVSVRLFDTVLTRLVDGVANTCACASDCRQYLVVEHNGDVYPCDFHVRRDLRLGNVHADAWDALLSRPAYEAFGRRKRQWNPACEACAYLAFCQGDCPKNRRCGEGAGEDPARLSHLCAGWRAFYAHALPRLKDLAVDVKRERARAASASVARGSAGGPAPGRNDRCPCGSGRKYKVCCGRPV
jgi:uncharacterized protein